MAEHVHSGGCGCSQDAKENSIADTLLPWIDTLNVNGQNCKQPAAPFKGFYDRFEIQDCAYSPENDPEMIIRVPFTAEVRVSSICVMMPEAKFAPNRVKIWKNRDDIDFQSAEDVKPTQEVDLPHDPTGVLQIPLKSFLFNNVSSLSLFFTGSNGGQQTKIQYIGLRGRGSQNKRQVINVVYELMANPADHKKTEDEFTNPSII